MERRKGKEQPVANRKFKDTIFRMLFSDRKNLLSLYNAINMRDYENPEELEIVTLDNAVYMGMKNDLAFILDMNLYLYEHQSTYNPNIPLRDLLYIAHEYQTIIDDRSLYSSVCRRYRHQSLLFFIMARRKWRIAVSLSCLLPLSICPESRIWSLKLQC